MTTDDTVPQISIDDEDIAEVPALPVAKEGEEIDWKAEAEKYQGIATRRGTKLTKLKTATKSTPEATPAADQAKKGELDFGQKAFLNTLGFKDPADHAYIQKVMKDTGQTLDAVVAIPVVQAELTRMGEERASQSATPSADGNNGRPASPARDKVEYWLAKGEMPPADQPQLRRDYVNAKLKKEQGGQSQFSSTAVIQ